MPAPHRPGSRRATPTFFIGSEEDEHTGPGDSGMRTDAELPEDNDEGDSVSTPLAGRGRLARPAALLRYAVRLNPLHAKWK